MTAPTGGLEPAVSTEPGLREHLAVLARRKRTIALTVVVTVAVAVVLSLIQTPKYRSSAQVRIPTSSPSGLIQNGGDTDPERMVRNEVDFVGSDAVTEAVEDELGPDSDISVGSSDDRDTLTFSSVSSDADEAADVANTWANTYVTVRRASTLQNYTDSRSSVRQRIEDINQRTLELQQSVTDLQNQAAAATDPNQQATLSGQATELQAEIQPQIDTLIAERTDLEATLNQLQVGLDLADEGGATVTRQAEAAAGPFEPNLLRNAVIALGVGLLLGVGLAFVREQLDDRVTTRGELEAAGHVPVLALVPRVGDRREKAERGLVSVVSPSGAAAEAYRSLRTSVRFLGVDRSLATLLVTSPGAGDGKSTTVANLALVMAQAGQRCAVVCGDLRRPTIHEDFGVAMRPGLSNVILGEVSLESAICQVPGQDNLWLLPSGDLPPNPSELLSSELAAKVIRTLADTYEMVLIDAPPVLPVTDPLVLAQHVDGVVLVADARHTSLGHVQEAATLLRQVGAPVVGSVLNDAELVGRESYGYYGSAPT